MLSHRIYYIRTLEEPTLPDDEPAVHPLQENLCYSPDGHWQSIAISVPKTTQSIPKRLNGP
jgi:hypothetical protein